MTSAIRTSVLISPVFTCEIASASRRTCNIRCFTQLFVVNMIARPIWAKDVKFGVYVVFVWVRIKRGYGRTDEWRTDGRTDEWRTDGYHKFLWNVFSKSYPRFNPRFILLDKTRMWLGKHVSQEFMISVRPSVRHSSVRPYPRFILTRFCLGYLWPLLYRDTLISTANFL